MRSIVSRSSSVLFLVIVSILVGFSSIPAGWADPVTPKELAEQAMRFVDEHLKINTYDIEQDVKKMGRQMERAIRYLDQIPALPEQKDLWFYEKLTKTKEDQLENLDEILKADFEVLITKSYIKDAYLLLKSNQNQISDIKKKIIQDTIAKTLPAESPGRARTWSRAIFSNADYDKRIAENRAQRDRLQAQNGVLEVKIAKYFINELQIPIKTTAQFRAIIYTSTGQDDIKLFAAVSNLRKLSQAWATELEQLQNALPAEIRNSAEANEEVVKAAQQYAAQRALMIRTIILMQERYVDNIDRVFLPRLRDQGQAIDKEVSVLDKILNNKDSRITANERQQIYQNINLMKSQKGLIPKYEAYLASRRVQALAAKVKLEESYAVAMSTFSSLQRSLNLSSFMAEQAFASEVVHLEIPDLVVFDTTQLQTQMGELQDMTVDLVKE